MVGDLDIDHRKLPRKKRSRIWVEHNDDEFKRIVRNSNSITEVLNYYGLENKGSNHRTLKERIEYLKIDISHFLINRKPNTWTKVPLEEIVFENKHPNYKTGRLKQRLYDSGLKEQKCEICGISNWNDLPISLHMDHIDGNCRNHSLNNLRILCPNCHSQTETYAGKNIKKLGNSTIGSCARL